MPYRVYNGHSLDELPFRAAFGVYGSYVCILINVLALIASFYTALYPLGGPYLDAQGFFKSYLAGPLLLFLYLCWKTYSWFKFPSHRPIWTPIKNIDIYSGMREGQRAFISGEGVTADQRRGSIEEMKAEKPHGAKGWAKTIFRSVF